LSSSLLDTLSYEVSGEAIFDRVAAISQFHRIQASPGFREAAKYVQRELLDAGVSATIKSYPAREDVTYFSLVGWQEWDCEAATLDLVGEDGTLDRLCDFRSVATSVIQRSASFEGDAEVVLLEDGTLPEHYDGVDVRGKLVLTRGALDEVYDLAVAQRGAIGILFDRMEETTPGRSRIDMPDYRRYSSFWWSTGEPKCFGFVLTPRQGEMLRSAIQSGQGVSIRASVTSRFLDGSMEVVEARIPGQTPEEVVVIGHLCHPKPAAHDNASGSATMLEAARALHGLIDDGSLTSPKRGIRFLWVPEINGTHAYLQDHQPEWPNWIAGLNLDMVGADQRKVDCSWELECPPLVMASFAADLLEALRERLLDPGTGLSGRGHSSLCRTNVAAFSGGSDHMLFSDPRVGVPMPTLIDWPDPYWHTSADTLDKLDPVMLERTAVLSAAYAYWVASAGTQESLWLGYHMSSRHRERLQECVQRAIRSRSEDDGPPDVADAWFEYRRDSEFLHDRHVAALQTLTRLSSEPAVLSLVSQLSDHASEDLERQTYRMRTAMADLALDPTTKALASRQPAPEAPWVTEARSLYPLRLHPTLVSVRSGMARLSVQERLAWYNLVNRAGKGWRTARYLAEYWSDGNRNLFEICELVELESGVSKGPELVDAFRLLAKMGLIELASVKATG